MRGAAQLMLFYGVYVLGFFRRFAERADTVATGSLVLPLGALVLGSAGVVLGWNRLAPEVPWLRARLSLLLVLLRSEEHTSELQSRLHLVCRLLLENKKH